MSRLNNPGMIVGRPTNNVYTALAFISALATGGALVYVLVKFHSLGIL